MQNKEPTFDELIQVLLSISKNMHHIKNYNKIERHFNQNIKYINFNNF